ncbi:putative quinol monooxygenase [Catenovulum maritimum]|uniref:Antibiotic biosynthesis monooxygenase n=1 Tax=Catenovulum maritimum TaxID=1513271 RepID=A0A0J8H1B0_9ALTE|nr:antibiotic biosynthesis monooxygenase [Catenovulum maritimum]KMT66808.1 antibiotic biosynthesis monooxygenase [Catenovulum maritimum]
MAKIILQGHILVPENELLEIKSALLIHSALTQAEAGCIIFEVNQDAEQACKFYVYEEFINKAAFDFHQARVKQSDWGKQTQNVSRHYQVKKVD